MIWVNLFLKVVFILLKFIIYDIIKWLYISIYFLSIVGNIWESDGCYGRKF